MSHDEVNSLHRAIDILMLLQQEGREIGISELSRLACLPKSTTFRIIATLESRGLIQQNRDNGKYWLGIKLFSLGMAIGDKLAVKTVASPYAKALSQKFNEVCHVAVLDQFSKVYPQLIIVEKIQSQQLLTYTPPAGSGTPCHCSGVGKCLLAYSSPDYIQKFVATPLPRYTSKTITEWDDLFREMDIIRKRGYAIDEEELEDGLICIASPILSKNRELIAAISISGPIGRLKSDRFDLMVEEVQKTAKAIANQMY